MRKAHRGWRQVMRFDLFECVVSNVEFPDEEQLGEASAGEAV